MNKRDESIKTYCKERGYADFVVEGGLDYLVSNWEKTVAYIARGYANMVIYDYLNDMDGRRILAEVLPLANEGQRIRYLERIKAMYEIFFVGLTQKVGMVE